MTSPIELLTFDDAASPQIWKRLYRSNENHTPFHSFEFTHPFRDTGCDCSAWA